MIIEKASSPYGVIIICLLLLACSESVVKISTPKEFEPDLYEVRILGEGIAPDSTKVYLVNPRETITEYSDPIFEGQDVGSVCYAWPGINELEISISGGYVDHVKSEWRQKDGRSVKINYVINTNCLWNRDA